MSQGKLYHEEKVRFMQLKASLRGTKWIKPLINKKETAHVLMLTCSVRFFYLCIRGDAAVSVSVSKVTFTETLPPQRFSNSVEFKCRNLRKKKTGERKSRETAGRLQSAADGKSGRRRAAFLAVCGGAVACGDLHPGRRRQTLWDENMSGTDDCVSDGRTRASCRANAAEPVKIDSAECRCCNCVCKHTLVRSHTHTHPLTGEKKKKRPIIETAATPTAACFFHEW